ncbi:hypothetical protein HA466_0042590 [Hirschfeldia incana]|nr:hypothetical protein HA466_0042590 [Hirschfeldia incana]
MGVQRWRNMRERDRFEDRVDHEITFNETIIKEREQGIREIQEQIGEVNEIFKDRTVLVNDQGVMIDDISSNMITHKLQLHKPLLNSEKHLNLKEQTHLWYTLLCCRHAFLFSF